MIDRTEDCSRAVVNCKQTETGIRQKMVVFISLRHISVAMIACVLTLSTVTSSDADNLRKLAKANNYLALTLHKILATSSSQNVFFSPFSLSSAFGMLCYGTRGETAQELMKMLGYKAAGVVDDEVHEYFHKYISEYMPKKDDAYTFEIANTALFDKKLQMLSSYMTNVQYLYQVTIRSVNFEKQRFEILQAVNDWVKQKTHGKIDHLVDEINPNTAMILLNAVYFKGTWKTQFKKKTFPGTFFNSGLESAAKEVPMMRVTSSFPHASFEDFHALELPYKGENISMLVLVPNQRDGLPTLEAHLTDKTLAAIKRQLDIVELTVTFPKFKVEYSEKLSSDFKALGAEKIFNSNADLSGISPSPRIYVSEVLHKAVIEVNEEGSEAAAVTGIAELTLSMSVEKLKFKVDHPFLYAIMDKRNDMILFLGNINVL